MPMPVTHREVQPASTRMSRMHMYGFWSPSPSLELREQMSACLREIALRVRSNRLQFNTTKTEVLWCATCQRQHQIPNDWRTVTLHVS